MSIVISNLKVIKIDTKNHFYPTTLKGCRGIVFTQGVWVSGWVAGKSMFGLYVRNRKV